MPDISDLRSSIFPFKIRMHFIGEKTLALGLLVLVCYLPAMLWGGFVWDDHLCIKVYPVQEVSGLAQIWFSPRRY